MLLDTIPSVCLIIKMKDVRKYGKKEKKAFMTEEMTVKKRTEAVQSASEAFLMISNIMKYSKLSHKQVNRAILQRLY